MSTSVIVLLSAVGVAFLWILFSGLLFRIFINVLLTVATIMLTGWIILLIGGVLLCYVLPAWCGLTGHDLVAVYNHIDKGDFSDFYRK